jgi:hypothetical protein
MREHRQFRDGTATKVRHQRVATVTSTECLDMSRTAKSDQSKAGISATDQNGTVTTSHNRCNYRRNQQLMAQCLWPWASSRSTRQRTPSHSRQTQANNVKQTFPFRLKYVLRQQRFGIQNYPVIAMNNGKSATLPLIEDHDAKAIPPIKRRIIIHDTSESEDDTSDLPARGSFDAHIVVNGNADGQHQGISLSGDPINIHRQHAQMVLPPLTMSSCACSHYPTNYQ